MLTFKAYSPTIVSNAQSNGMPVTTPNGQTNMTVQYVESQTIQADRTPSDVLVAFDGNSSWGLGIAQIMLGLMSVFLGVVRIYTEGRIEDYYHTSIYSIGFAIWCPVFYFMSGALAILAGKQKTHRYVNLTLQLSIYSMLFAFVQFTAMSVSVGYVHSDYNDKIEKFTVAIGSLLLIFGFAEMVMSIYLIQITSHQVCRRGCCSCCDKTSTTAPNAVMHYATGAAPAGHTHQNALFVPQYNTNQMISATNATGGSTYSPQYTAAFHQGQSEHQVHLVPAGSIPPAAGQRILVAPQANVAVSGSSGGNHSSW